VIIRVDKDKQVATVIANPDNNTAESVVIPASVTIEGKSYPVTTIGEGAFQGYESLSELTLPQTVTTIGANAFAGCTSLSLVTCHAMTVPVMPKNAFDDEAYSQATLMVPYNALNNYKKDSSWKQFANMDVSYKKGDANGDGVIDVEDIVAIVNYILGSPASNFIPEAADYNSDNLIDVEDIVGVVNSIMNGNPNYNAPQMRRILMNYGFKF
jgi:hypothetical protein